MSLKRCLLALLVLAGSLLSQLSWAQTSASNVRLRTDPTVRKVIIEYELPQVLPDDSLYIELETASGRIIRPVSVNGDVGAGIKAGKNKLVAWDVVRDNVRLNEDVKVLLRVARMVSVADPAKVAKKPVTEPVTRPVADRVAEPGTVVRQKSIVPIIGWVATGGLAGYATVIALGLNKDADEYNSKPFADNAAEKARFDELKAKIDKNKTTFTIVAGAAAVVAIANVVYMVVGKPKPARTSLLIQSGGQVTSIGLSHKF
ncbi:hypothetical protein GCM10027341_47620 [Spirosoma knui]